MENSETEKRKVGRPRIYNYPKELVCTVTGKPVKTNPVQFKKQLEKSGLTQEEYIKTFVSREGKKTLNPKPIKKVKKLITPSVTQIDMSPEELQREINETREYVKEAGTKEISSERLALLNKYFPAK